MTDTNKRMSDEQIDETLRLMERLGGNLVHDAKQALLQLRSQLTEATEAMHCAVLKIQDGSPHHAEGVLSDVLARLEDEGDKE